MKILLRCAPIPLLGLALLGAVAGCTREKEAEAAPVAVEAAPARIAPISEHIVADAVLAPIAQAAISPKITAPVKKFYVQRGAKVKAGELLATLENDDLQAAVTDNEGAYDAANAGYQTAVKAQVPEDYRKAELDVAQAKANLDLNRAIVSSREKLFADGAIPGRDLDTAKAALVAAQAAYETAAQHMDSMKQVSREAALKAAQGDLESARGKFEGAKAELSYSEIRSPIAGVVTDRPLYAGETAPSGSPLITVMDTSALLARIHLSQLQAQLLKAGDAASVEVPGLADPVTGKVTLVSPATDPGSTTVEIWVRIENPKGALRPGTAVHVALEGRTVPHALVIPSAAIVLGASGKATVLVIGSDGVAHLTPVETGIAGDDTTQILSGLSAGQQVVTVGAASLDDGTHVKVVTSTDDEDKPSADDSKGKDDGQ
jgi:HlyD family secretion protein